MRAAVLGATGLVGSAIVRRLKADDWDVCVPSRKIDLREAEWSLTTHNSTFADSPCDAIFHAADAFAGNAALTEAKAADQLLDNARMDLSVLRAWKQHQPQAKLIAFLSLWAYPSKGTIFSEEDDLEAGPMPPQTAHYGAVKRLLAHALAGLRAEGMQSALLTLPNVYGPGDRSQRIVPTILRAMLTGHPMTLRGNGLELRDFAFVDDVAAAAVDCATSDITGRVHVSAGQPTSIRRLVALAAEKSGYPEEVRFEGDMAPSRYLRPSPRTSHWTFRDLGVGLEETIAAKRASYDVLFTASS